jgi:CSLREA domain-containing protein
MLMYAIHPVVKRAASAAFLLSLLVACQDTQTPTAPLDLHPRLTQVATNPVVNSLADPGTGTCDDTECTLREAIAFASSGATITFAPAVIGTITLGDYLYLNQSLIISGPGADNLAISGGNSKSLFWLTAGNSSISGLTLTNAYYSLGSGGGAVLVSNAGTGLTLSHCAITNSNGGAYGGAVRVSNGTVTVSSCTLSGNTASSGAAIIVFAGTTRILNSTISGNTGSSAVDAIEGTVVIDHSTIAGNSAIGAYSSYTSYPVSVKGSIIWGNGTADVSAGQDNAFTSLGYNLLGTDGDGWVDFGHDFTATGDQTGVTDAKLGSLALNSPGTTQTRALLAESPAIDAGVCTDFSGATLTADQRGVSRPQGSNCDIGAYELVASGATTPTFVFNLSTLPAKTFGDGGFSVVSYATTNSTGAITFATGTGSVGCSVTSGGMVSITGAAINPNACILEASLGADVTYTSAGPISQSFNIAKAAGSVTINNIPSSATVGGSFTPTYTKLGDGTATTASNSTGICTVTSGVVDYIAAGTCLLQASVTAGTNHLAATGTEQSFTVALTAPTFSFDLSGLAAKTYGDGSFSVAGDASTNSSGAVTFATGAGSVGCSATSAGTVTISGAAVDPSHCIIEATLAADATYGGAGPISQSFNIAKAAGSVTINNIPSSGTVNGSFTPTYTKLGDGTASTVSHSTGVCTVTSGVVNYIAEGTCLLQASVTAGTNHLAASGTEQSFSISLQEPTFTFDVTGITKTYGDADFSVAGYVTTNSSGAVTFAIGSSSTGCSVTSAGMVTITASAVDPAHCVIAATLAADGTYSGSGPYEDGFNIARAAGSVSINNMPASAVVGGNFTPAFARLGDGTASVVSLTEAVCTVSGGVVTFNAAGTCTLQPSVTEGANYLAATGSQQSVTVTVPGVFASSCTYTIHPKNDQRLVTVTWENADPGVTQIQVVDGRTITRQLAPTTTGSWSTNVKTGVPSYGLWGGAARRDTSTILVVAGTACTAQ